jgi:hypothetical protein
MAMRCSNAMATTLIHFIQTSFDNERMLDSTRRQRKAAGPSVHFWNRNPSETSMEHGFRRQTNICELDKRGRLVVTWCFGPEGNLPTDDILPAQKIALETNEQSGQSDSDVLRAFGFENKAIRR